jgi:hypothetical protein
MIDPVTVADGVSIAVEFTATVMGYINDVKCASEDRKNLLHELTSTHYLLYRIKDQANQAHWDDKLSETMKWLGTPKGPLEQFKGALEKLASKLKPAEGLKKAGKALTWYFDKKAINEILQTIQRQKLLFELVVQCDHM